MANSNNRKKTGTELLASLDQGRLGFFIKLAFGVALIITIALINLYVHFIGFNSATAMNQAQIARNIASGKGFTTDVITPHALATLTKAKKFTTDKIDAAHIPDIYESPLVPYLYAVPLAFARSLWTITPNDTIYQPERILAILNIVLMILALVVWYRVLVTLFDPLVATTASVALGLTDILWLFSLSALPQMSLLLLFGVAMLFTVYAEEQQAEGNLFRCMLFLLIAGVFFGLMALTHGLAVWIFLGWLVFVGIYFHPRGFVVLLPLLAALLIATPWLVRNYMECGNPIGIAYKGAFDSSSPYDGFLRFSEDSKNTTIKFSIRDGIPRQLNVLFSYLGINILAIAFFMSLLHRFRNESPSKFRWGFAIMWAFALLGMCFYRPDSTVSVNQIHVIFLPAFVGYGVAFCLVLWGRWNITLPIFRTFFLALLVLLCSVPMLLRFTGGSQRSIAWPPYIPSFIGGIVCPWFTPDEIICADIPWATAWYGQRISLLIPSSVQAFNTLRDYSDFKQPICGLYLTPVSLNKRLSSEIYRGKYAEWVGLFTRPPRLTGFPFQFVVPLPIDQECLLYADRARWNEPRKIPETDEDSTETSTPDSK